MDLEETLKPREINGIPGLYIIITQDHESKQILMQAFANTQAVEKTVETGLAHYYSTSRKKLWLKGESSGNTQKVKRILIDCDADAIIYQVEQEGGACHKGYDTCFYRELGEEGLKVVGEKLFDPEEVYK